MAGKWAALVTKKAVPRAQETVISCISKPSDQRRTTEIDMILPWFRKKSDLLRSVDREVLIEIIRGCQYKKAIKNEIIIKQGDIGDCFYIILTGKTSIYIDTAKSDDDPNPNQGPPATESARDKLIRVTAALTGLSRAKLKTVRDRTTLGKFIICFESVHDFDEKRPVKNMESDDSDYSEYEYHFQAEAGKSFGEIALISEDSVRNASIVADEESDLLVVHRDLFNSTLKAKQEQEYQERKDFIDSNPLFCHWNAKFKRLLEMSLRKETLPFDTRIVTQGEPIVGLHFITKGRAKVIVAPSKHRRQFPRLFDDVDIYDIHKRSMKQTVTNGRTPTEHVCTQNQIRVRRNEGYAAAERRLTHRNIHVCTVEEKEVIGDVEMVFDMPTYLQTVTCTSNTEVMILDMKNYDRLITKKNPQTIDQMKLALETKLKGKLQSTNGANIPLFKNILGKIESARPKKNQSVIDDEFKSKDDMYAQLIELYLDDKVTNLVDPVVPNSVYYRYKTIQRRKAKEAWDRRMKISKTPGPPPETEPRKNPATPHNIRRPRTRRELQNITIGPPPSQQRNRPRTAPPRVSQRTQKATDTTGSKTFITELHNGVSQDEADESLTHNQSHSSLKFIQNGHKVTPSTEEEDSYYDVETSHKVLSDLEDRLQSFHSKLSESVKRQSTRVAELRRFELQNAAGVPVPGGSVYVKRKPCKYATRNPGTKLADDSHSAHEHVRRFMLPKNSFVNNAFANNSQQLLAYEMNNNTQQDRRNSNEDIPQPSSRSESPVTKNPRTTFKRPRPSTAGARLGVVIAD